MACDMRRKDPTLFRRHGGEKVAPCGAALYVPMGVSNLPSMTDKLSTL